MSVPEHDAYALLKLSDTVYETKYPQMFMTTDNININDFFK